MRVRAALVAVAAALAAAPAALALDEPVEYRLVSRQTIVKRTDREPSGPSRGDSIFMRTRLLNLNPQFGRGRGDAVGSDWGRITVLDASTVRIEGIATLPGGTIRIRGLADRGRRSAVIPVIGGTGRYRGVRGSLTIVWSGAGEALNVYKLSPTEA
jgi:hypothetical protein